MNKGIYKVIFSTTLQQMIAVWEYGRGKGKNNNCNKSRPAPKLRLLPVCIALACGLAPASLWAQSVITEDDLAAAHERPTVLKTANGLPQIDIQTPDESGISMNRYSQFDVDSAGAIMNNARKDAATQTGGVVTGNPHLARGEADLIVNQVRSQTASNLQGTIEIAGKKADVIVANPAGIMVNGGFINAGKVHYTAGQVEIKQGKPVQHSSESGVINIAPGGLNAQNHDYTTLLARQIKINGAIHGEGSQIDLITGNNTLHADGTIENSSKQADKPVRFAVDSSALGGMYANRIRLIGTEKGVGVHHAGKLQTDALELSLPGTLHNQGEITANQLDIKTTGLKNDGTLHHSSDQTLTIRSNIFANHDGARLQDRQAEKNTEKPQPAENKNEETRKGAVGRIEVAEKIENRGSITSGGKIDLASKDYENHGNVAINLFTLREGKLDNRDGSSTFESADIKASQLDNARGELFLYRAKPIQVKGEVNNHGGQIHGVDSLSISAGKINNTGGGSITSDNTLSLQARGSINNAGSIGANNSVSLQAGKDIANSGQIRSGSGLNLSAGNDITNGGQLFAGNTLNLSAGNDINNSATISGDLLNISANRLNNSETGSITQRGPYTLNIHTADYDTANNPYGTIRTQKPANSAASNTTSTAPGSSTDNEQPSTEGTLKIRSQFNNRGVFEINNMLSVTASNSFTNHQTAEFARLTLTNGATLDNSHGELRSQEMRFDSRDINNSHGTLKTNTLQLNAAKLDNSHGRIDIAKQGNINVTGTWNNNHGTINSNHSLTIRSQQADNSGGSISSNHDLSLYNLGSWNNGNGQLLAGRNMTLSGGSLNNQGRIQAGEQFNYNGFTQLNQGGQLFAGNITLNGKQLNNSGETGSADTLHIQTEETRNSGKISSQNTFTFNSAKTENSGQLLTNSLFTLNTAELNNRGKISSAGDANIKATSVDNSGDIHAKEKLNLRGNTLKNRGTAAAGETDVAADTLENGGILSGKTRVTVSTPQMNNRGGSIVSDQDVTINTPELDNEQGHIASKGKLTLNVKAGSAINNKHGVLASEEDLELDTARLDNEGGNIHSGKTLRINTPELNNQGGSIDATAHHLQSTSINNENGHLIGRESLTLTSDGEKLNNRGGQIISKGALNINAKNTNIDSTGGYIVGKDVDTDVGVVSGGKIESWDELKLRAKKVEKMESVRSGGNMNIQTQDKYTMNFLHYSGGWANIHSDAGIEIAPGQERSNFQGNLLLSSKSYITNEGLIASVGKTIVQAPEYIENRNGGRIYGAHVAINTKRFTNNGASVLGVERVDIGAEKIINTNRAAIAAGLYGSIHIGRDIDAYDFALWQADHVINEHGGRINAGGDVNINSKKVDNFSEVSVDHITVSKTPVEFYSNHYTQTEWFPENRQNDRGAYKYSYQLAEIEKRPVINNPGVISAGGTLTFDSDDVYNEGRIVAGRIGGAGKNAINGGNMEGTRYTAALDGEIQFTVKKHKDEEPYLQIRGYIPPRRNERTVHFTFGTIEENGKISGNPNAGGGWSPGSIGGVPFPGGSGSGGGSQESNVLDAIDKEGRAVPYRVMTPNLPQLPTQSLFQLNMANVDPVPAIPGMPDMAQQGLITYDPVIYRIMQNLPQYRPYLAANPIAAPGPNRYGNPGNNTAYGSGATVGTPYTDFSRSIGDRYYNYHLVADMVARSTGYRYLKGYHDDASQFAALTAAGNSFRERYQIAPGVSLTAEQAKHLDQDMILMVDRTFTLPDGRQVTRQVPQLYARIQPDELDTSRPTIGANRIDLSGSGTLSNNGSIGGRDSLSLQYQNISNRGTLTSDHGNVHARDTFDGKGGTINAGKYFSATAGKTFNFQPQTSDIDGSADRAANRSYHSAHQIEDSGQLKRYATGSTVILGGAKETNLKATQLDLGDKSSRTQITGGKVNLNAEYVHDVKMDDQGGGNYHYRYHGEDQGVETTGDGALSVTATSDKLTVNAAKLNSGKNRVSLYGAKGIDVTHGEIIDKEVTSSNHKGGGLFSRSHTRDYESWESHQVKTSDITGDSVALVADRGDINAVGSNIVGEHGALLQTRQGNITLKAGENTYHSEERHSKHKVGLMGSGGIGLTLGSRSQSSDNTLDLKGHTPTLVGAIDGNVTIDAGGHYSEQGAIVHAGRAGGPLTKEQWLALSPAERARAGNVYLNAQSADLDVMRGEQKQEMNSRYKQSGLTLRLNIPLLSAARSALKNLGYLGESNNSKVVKMMAASNAVWNGYEATKAAKEALADPRTLVNAQLTLGTQHSSSWQKSREDLLQTSQLSSDAGVYLNIRGKGEGSTLNVTGSDLGGSAITVLRVEGEKNFKSAEARREMHSEQHSDGFGIGPTIQLGSRGFEYGVGADGNIAHGNSDEQRTLHRLSHVGGLTGHTDIGDGKTELNGAQILGHSLSGNTRDLKILVPQETLDYQSRQFALGGHVLAGVGVSGDLDYQNTRVDAHEKTVNVESGHRDAVRGVQESDNSRIQALTGSIKQNDELANRGQSEVGGISGAIAGDGGYQIHNRGTAVIQGIITSSEKAEAEGKNHFSTDRLVREEIHNYSNYKGQSIALGVRAVLGGKTLGQEQDERFINVGDSDVGKTFGIGREQRSQEGVTIGSVNTANLTIHDDAGQRQLTGESAAEAAKNANRGITLENNKARSGAASVGFDADKVTRDITSTAQVMQGFDGTIQGIKRDLRKQAETYRARGDEESAAKLDKLAVGLDMLKGGLTPTDSALGTIANTAAPLVSYQIGQYAKAHGSEGSAGHIAAHAALAALTTAANGGSSTDIATSAGTSAAAELGAPLLAKGFYGTSDSSKLTAEQKETISNILGLAAAGTGAMTGGNSATAYNAGKSAQNAVENNFLSDLAWGRLTASEEHVEKGTDSPLDRSIVIEENEINQKSDYLLNKAKRGEKLSEQEWRYLNNAVNKYHIETEEQYGRAYADKAVYDLLFNNKPAMRQSNYSYPFASTNTHKEEWKQLNPERITHKFIIGDVIDQGGFQKNSRIYHTAQDKNRWAAEDQYYAQMGHGATLAMGGSGVLSNMVRTTVAASGAGTTYHGINEIKQGNTISGTFFSVLGIADMFSAGASQVMASKGLGINKPVMTSESENLAGLYKPSPVSLAEATPIKSGEPRFILNNTGYAFEPNNTNILRGPNGGSIARTGVRYGPWGEVYFENGRYFVPGNNGKRVYIKSDSLNPYKRPEIPEIISQTKHLGKTTPPSVPPSGSAIDASLSQLRVFNGKALHPDLPSPVAGLDYIPKQLNSPNVNIRYSQVNGYLAEIDLANDLAASGRRVLKWGDRIGKHGNDVITVNPKTGTVELWDNKFRSTPAAGEISPTFRNQKTLSAALREARDYIQHSNLPPSLKAKAMDNIDKGSVTVYTTASGEVDFSTMNKVINGILQE